MANPEHVKILVHDGVAVWNRWRNKHRDIQPDLRSADLHGAKLEKADLREADLIEADLRWANLRWANLHEANLGEANLSRATLSHAHLVGANFLLANLGQANLTRARLSRAEMTRADLSGADLTGAELVGSNLHEARLVRSRLREADLRAAILIKANLGEARLIRANLREASLSGANLDAADLSEADLTDANLNGTGCRRTNFSGATLTGCNVYGVSAWDVNLEGAVQDNLRIIPEFPEGESHITLDNLEVAQFLYLMLHNEKMRAVLDTITSKVVLILGRFSSERKPILDALREALRRHPNGYIPVLFDFEPQHDKPVLETVKTLANLARFVIADLTDPHMVRAELTAIVPNVPTVPVQPIIQGNAALPTEHESWALYRSVMPVYRYDDLTQLLASLDESVITPAETHVQARHL